MTHYPTHPLSESDLLAAVIFATEAHAGQVRKHIGEPYILHPLRVSHTLAMRGMPYAVLIAGVLHDVVEDCGVSLGELTRKFGADVSALVDQVTNVAQPKDGNRKARAAIDLAHITKCSPAGATIKLADILDNVPSIVANDLPFAAIYVPEKLAQLEVLRHGDASLVRRVHDLLAQASVEVGDNPVSSSRFYSEVAK